MSTLVTNPQPASSWKDSALVVLALVYSGNPALGRVLPIEPQLVILALFFFFVLTQRTSRIFSSNYLIIVASFAVILLIQCWDFAFYPFVTMAGFFVRLFIGYALIRIVTDFPYTFMRVMVGLALLSFAIHIPYVIMTAIGVNVEGVVTSMAEILGTASVTRNPLFLHTLIKDEPFRNAGMFWEPGAFQGYLILALIFLSFCKKRISRNEYVRALVILYVGVLTTLSTTGFIALALIPLLHYDWRGQNRKQVLLRIGVGGAFVIPLLVSMAFNAYWTLPFLGEKIASQLEAVDQRTGRWHRGRMGSLVFDWEYIQERPFTGWGLHSSTRYALHPWMESSEGMGNGFSDFTAKFGILGFMIWLIAVYRGFNRLSVGRKFAPIVSCFILLLLLQGEGFLGYPIFLSLAFLGTVHTLRIRRKYLPMPSSILLVPPFSERTEPDMKKKYEVARNIIY